MYHLAVTGGCVDYRTAVGHDAYMTAYYDDVAGPQVGEAGDLLVFSNIAPAGGGQIALTDAYLVQAPVYKAGTVKGIRSFGAPDIGASQLGAGYGDQRAGASRRRTGAGGAAAGLGRAAAGIVPAGTAAGAAAGTVASPTGRRRIGRGLFPMV